jgi:hypothetical protein
MVSKNAGIEKIIELGLSLLSYRHACKHTDQF